MRSACQVHPQDTWTFDKSAQVDGVTVDEDILTTFAEHPFSSERKLF
jgi:hypothetical protein